MSGDDRPDVLNYLEIEAYVEGLQKSNKKELGSLGWLEKHERIKQLTVQSVIQALSNREETVKEMLITHDKLKILIYDLILVELWREEILPELNKQKLTQSFTIYPVLYHECACINLLETVLYHHETAETLGEGVVDLTDYCIRLLSYFIAVGNDDEEDDLNQQDENGSGDLQSKAKSMVDNANEDIDMNKISQKLRFGNCFKALSTLRYIIENVDSLGSGLISRLIVSSDSPMLFTQLLLQKPWRRENWQTGKITEFDPASATWKKIDPSSRLLLGRTEVQCWLALFLLLKNNKILSMYEMYDGRRNQLLKLRPFLNDYSLDQLPILVELQFFLNHLAMHAGGPSAPCRSPLLLELIAPIRDQLEMEFKDNRKALVKLYSNELINASRESLMERAKILAASYDFNNFESTLPSSDICALCGSEADKRCSKCRQTWYCSRDCQVEHWKIHKANCGNQK